MRAKDYPDSREISQKKEGMEEEEEEIERGVGRGTRRKVVRSRGRRGERKVGKERRGGRESQKKRIFHEVFPETCPDNGVVDKRKFTA